MFKSPRLRAFFVPSFMNGGKSRGFRLSIVSLSGFARFFDIDRRREKGAATRLVYETKPLAELAEKEVGKHDALLSMKVVTGAIHIVLGGALLMLQE
jgi:hypothetical protein